MKELELELNIILRQLPAFIKEKEVADKAEQLCFNLERLFFVFDEHVKSVLHWGYECINKTVDLKEQAYFIASLKKEIAKQSKNCRRLKALAKDCAALHALLLKIYEDFPSLELLRKCFARGQSFENFCKREKNAIYRIILKTERQATVVSQQINSLIEQLSEALVT